MDRRYTDPENKKGKKVLRATEVLKPNRKIGLIAEDVAAVWPEFVDYDSEGRPDGVHYAMLVAPLIGVAKNHGDRIKDLESQIAILQDELDALKG